MTKLPLFLGLAALLTSAVAACSGTADSGDSLVQSDALAFHNEASPLKDFAYDTGLLPAGSPAQVQLKLSAGGAIKIDAAAERGKDGITGKPGGGKVTLDLHVKVDGRLKVDSTLKKYDGELPGLKDIDIPILGEVPFDGLLLGNGESAEVKADLPEITLPEIPLGATTVGMGSSIWKSRGSRPHYG